MEPVFCRTFEAPPAESLISEHSTEVEASIQTGDSFLLKKGRILSERLLEKSKEEKATSEFSQTVACCCPEPLTADISPIFIDADIFLKNISRASSHINGYDHTTSGLPFAVRTPALVSYSGSSLSKFTLSFARTVEFSQSMTIPVIDWVLASMPK